MRATRLLLLPLMVSCNCHRRAPADPPPPELPVVNATPTAADATAAYAAANNLEPLDVELEVFEDVSVPGVIAFRAFHYDEDDIPADWAAGAMDSQGVAWGADAAISKVLGAWGYGPSRTKTAVEVAAVAGFLEVTNEETTPLLKAEDWSYIKAAWQEPLEAPKESEVDGQPAVVYWNSSAEPPLWRTTLVVGPDGHRRIVETIWDLL